MDMFGRGLQQDLAAGRGQQHIQRASGQDIQQRNPTSLAIVFILDQNQNLKELSNWHEDMELDMFCLIKQADVATYSGHASHCSGSWCREKETNSTCLITSMIMTCKTP